MVTTIIKSNKLKEFYTPEKCFITEFLNTNDHPECSIARARVEPGIITEWHWLHQTDEMYYILSGKGEFEMDGDFIGVVTPGDLVFIPRNSNQRIKNYGKDDLVFLCICNPRFEPENYHTDKLHAMKGSDTNAFYQTHNSTS